MPYNIKQLGEKSVSIDFFIADPMEGCQDHLMDAPTGVAVNLG